MRQEIDQIQPRLLAHAAGVQQLPGLVSKALKRIEVRGAAHREVPGHGLVAAGYPGQGRARWVALQ